MNEAELARAAKDGDLHAFEALATPCEGMIWRACFQLMGNAADAQDMAQNAMIKAWTHLDTWKEEAKFSTWLYRIAVTCCLDERRKRTAHPAASMEDMRDNGFDPPAREEGPLDQVLRRERSEAIREALNALPDEQRVPLILSSVEGRPYDEIARILSLPEGTVKSRIARARMALRKKLQDPEDPHRNFSSPAPSKETKTGYQSSSQALSQALSQASTQKGGGRHDV